MTISESEMEKVDITIIGAGVIGLSIASYTANKKRNVILIERHNGFGEETSSRNSEVIHAGIYYTPGSLKAQLCVEGNRMLHRICKNHGIACNFLGKLIVAVNEREENGLQDIRENGRKNGAGDLKIISSEEVKKLEPNVKANAAIFSPSSGIIDSHRLMKYFETAAKSNDVNIVYGCEVRTIEKTPGGFQVGIQDTDGQLFSFFTRILINSAGLESGNIAGLAGIDIDQAGYRTHYYKGEYFRVGRGKHKLAHRLVYPFPPRPGYTGIHTVPDLQGMMKLGPYNYTVENIDYKVDDTNKELIVESVKTFLPFIEFQDIEPDMSGIQPKIQNQVGTEKDFIIKHEEEKGLPGLINLIGIDSPGLTASPAIGEFVGSIVAEII